MGSSVLEPALATKDQASLLLSINSLPAKGGATKEASNDEDLSNETEQVYPTGFKLALTTLALRLAAFLTGLVILKP
jgi:hypothetical protein